MATFNLKIIATVQIQAASEDEARQMYLDMSAKQSIA